MTQTVITETIVVGKEYRKFTSFFTDPMRVPGEFGQKNSAKPLAGPGDNMVHWAFGKSEVLPLTF
jgi:hypothetical protein